VASRTSSAVTAPLAIAAASPVASVESRTTSTVVRGITPQSARRRQRASVRGAGTLRRSERGQQARSERPRRRYPAPERAGTASQERATNQQAGTLRRMSLLPDPEPRARRFTVISVDDHLIEPPDLFDGRMPAALADHAPR